MMVSQGSCCHREAGLLTTVLVVGAAARLAILYCNIGQHLEVVAEVATPLTRYSSLFEGIYLWQQGLAPYSSDTVHHSPAVLVAFRGLSSLGNAATSGAYIACDVLAAWLLARAVPLHATFVGKTFPVVRSPQLPVLIAALYLLQPYTLAACVARSTTTWANLAVSGAFWAALQGNVPLSTLSLAFGTHVALYPTLLVAPIAMMQAGSAPEFAGICVAYAGWLLALAYAATLPPALYGGYSAFLVATLGVWDLTPNVGIFWYFFLEIFDHFRTFYLCVFHLHMVAYLAPLAIKLRGTPTLLFVMLGFLAAAFKTYPSGADAAVPLALLPLWYPLFPYTRWGFAVGAAYVACTVLLPVMRHLWLHAASGNANFYYALTVVATFAHVAVVVDLLQAYGRREHDRQRGLSVAAVTHDVIMR